jgi:hypothetical protein
LDNIFVGDRPKMRTRGVNYFWGKRKLVNKTSMPRNKKEEHNFEIAEYLSRKQSEARNRKALFR